MSRKKLKKYNEFLALKNCFGKDSDSFKGSWSKEVFNNSRKIVLELGCGYGEYTTSLAAQDLTKNYIGIDIKSDRLWQGAKTASKQKLNNVAFLRIEIDKINNYFSSDEVDSVWITFPDPRPKHSDRHRRLTSSKYLAVYKQFSSPNTVFYLKTDSTELYDFTLKELKMFGGNILDHTNDLYNSRQLETAGEIQTRYEKEYLNKGETIKLGLD